jgi:hypothetical protein
VGSSQLSTPKLLTADEAAALAGELSGQPCTARQVRYLLIRGRLGTDVSPGRHGETRVFGVLDLAFLRLALELHAQGVSPAVARTVLTYLHDDLVRAWRAAASMAVAVTGVKGSLEPVSRGRPKWAVAWVPLRDLWRDLESQIHRVREARPDIWMWRHRPVAHVAAERGRTLLR